MEGEDDLPASVCEDRSTGSLEGLDGVISLKSCSNLFTAWRNEEIGLGLQASGGCLLDNVLRALHILVRTVGAAANEASTESLRPALLLDDRLELRERGGEIRGEGTVDMRLEG